eukprot:3380518-Amphidinium_carterae.1
MTLDLTTLVGHFYLLACLKISRSVLHRCKARYLLQPPSDYSIALCRLIRIPLPVIPNTAIHNNSQ